MTQINSINAFQYQNTPSNRLEEVAMAVTRKARVSMLVAAIAFGGAICAVGPASGQEPIRIGAFLSVTRPAA
jgi:hypothetical protein